MDANYENNDELFRSVGGVPLAQGDGDVAWYFGWIPRQATVDAYLRRRELRFFRDSPKSQSFAPKVQLDSSRM